MIKRKRNYEQDRAGFRRFASELLDRGVVKKSDLDNFARRLSNATSAEVEGRVIDDWLRYLMNAMERNIQRMMQRYNASHPTNH